MFGVWGGDTRKARGQADFFLPIRHRNLVEVHTRGVELLVHECRDVFFFFVRHFFGRIYLWLVRLVADPLRLEASLLHQGLFLGALHHVIRLPRARVTGQHFFFSSWRLRLGGI